MTVTSPRSHTPKGSRARDKILLAAERLLVSRGFHGTSMRDVAEAAGLPLATVVYHFAKKEHLYGAVLGAIGADLERRLAASTGGTGAHAARLDALVVALLVWCEERPGRVKLLVRELLDNESRVARAARLPLATVLLGMTELVADGVRAGVFRAVDPETAVLHLVGAVSYHVAAQPTIRRIVGTARLRQLAASYAREVTGLARRLLLVYPPEISHGSQQASQPRAPRARARRAAHDGHGRRPQHGGDADVPR
jgi:AcrR family transcriptional regulator